MKFIFEEKFSLFETFLLANICFASYYGSSWWLLLLIPVGIIQHIMNKKLMK